MIIPKLHYISQGNSAKEHLDNIQKACTSGVELVQLGIKNISEKKFLKIATEAREITSHFQTRLIINGDYKIAKEVKADGVYLEQPSICPIVARKHLYKWQSIGGAANTLKDCETLLDKEVNYIILGPLRKTAIKDNLEPFLGLEGFMAITDVLKTPIPILASGGITIEDIKSLLEVEISGVAVSDAITKDFDSVKRFNKLLSASSTDEQRYTFDKA
jgi:thiamine-phosphate pyrophosphorylase